MMMIYACCCHCSRSVSVRAIPDKDQVAKMAKEGIATAREAIKGNEKLSAAAAKAAGAADTVKATSANAIKGIKESMDAVLLLWDKYDTDKVCAYA